MAAETMPIQQKLNVFMSGKKSYESFIGFGVIEQLLYIFHTQKSWLFDHKHLYTRTVCTVHDEINESFVFNIHIITFFSLLQCVWYTFFRLITHLANAFLNFTSNVSSTIRLFISNKIMVVRCKQNLSHSRPKK